MRILLFFFHFIITFGFSQSAEGVKVEYLKQVNTTSPTYESKGQILASKDKAIDIEYNNLNAYKNDDKYNIDGILIDRNIVPEVGDKNIWLKEANVLEILCYGEYKNEKVLVKDPGIEMEWEITKDKKEINSFVCYKAHMEFRGRKFEAWYAPDIPISFGPWKFRGLPGLILEVYDIDMLFKWTLTKISYPVQLDKSIFDISSDGFRTFSLKEFLEYVKYGDRENLDNYLWAKIPYRTEIVHEETLSLEKFYEWEDN